MSSITDFAGAAVEVRLHDDDARRIRARCQSAADWQAEILRSLCMSGWTLSMLVWLPSIDALSWFLLLVRERDARRAAFDATFETENIGSEQAHCVCGQNPERWFVLALQVLNERGWSRTMLANAFGEPRTNVIRRLDRQVSQSPAQRAASA